jgi:hypothetical protein
MAAFCHSLATDMRLLIIVLVAIPVLWWVSGILIPGPPNERKEEYHGE